MLFNKQHFRILEQAEILFEITPTSGIKELKAK